MISLPVPAMTRNPSAPSVMMAANPMPAWSAGAVHAWWGRIGRRCHVGRRRRRHGDRWGRRGWIHAGGWKTAIDLTDLIWKRARMAGFSLFAQSPTAIATAWRDIIPLIVGGSVKPIVERVYPLGEAGEALRHLIEDRPFGKVVLKG